MIIICFHGCGQNPTLFMSLLKPMKKKFQSDFKWVFPKGEYYKGHNKWGWYDRDYDEDVIDKGISPNNITKYKNIEHCILIGFSEGGEFALELAQHLDNVKGVIAMSPSYNKTVKKININCPVILISSINEHKISKKYILQWKRLILDTNLQQINHYKGHKVYIPPNIQDFIKF